MTNGFISICDNDTMEESKNLELSETQAITDIESGFRNVVQFLKKLSIDEHAEKGYSLNYINIFSKGCIFSPVVRITMPEDKKKSNEPMILEYKIGKVGQIKYFLSPKIE